MADDVIRVVSLSTPYPVVSHLMDTDGEALCRVELRFRLAGSRPSDDWSLRRNCVPCQNIYLRMRGAYIGERK